MSQVFTKNTNIISNFDNVYIIECHTVEEARFVYSYYIDKVAYIADLSNAMVIADNEEDIADLANINTNSDSLSKLNDLLTEEEFTGYIALIDTGANNADIKLSVIGEDVNDNNGHGNKMFELIKSGNPNANIISIKAFEDSTASVADIYAAIKLAIEYNVSVINMSFVGADNEKNAIIKEVIQEALNKGITIIGAAGNYNLDAKLFIPGCIDGVKTVGAANENGTKFTNSNYNADVYVVANSTSEASAKYTGYYTGGKLLNNTNIFTTLNSTDSNEIVIELPSNQDGNDDTHDDKIVA